MVRVNSRSKAAAAAAKAKAKAAPKGVQTAIDRLAKSKSAEVETGADGSETRRKHSRRKDVESNQTLTKTEGKLLESTLEYSKQTSRPGRETENSFVDRSDMLGRRSTQSRTETRTEKQSERGDTSRHTITTKNADVYGITKSGREQTVSSTLADGARTATHASTSDSVGNAHKASDVTTVRQQGEHTVTRNEKRSKGSELETRSSTTYDDGVFTLGGGADWKKGTNVEKSFLRERDADSSRVTARADKLAERVGKVMDWLGLEPAAWSSEVAPERMHEKTLVEGEHGSVSTQYGVTGHQSAQFDGQGISATFKREARAGVYAESSGRVSGRFGEASYDARAKAEVKASVDANGRLDLNGLDASVNLRVGASVEAEVTGRASTKSVTISGVEVDASVEGYARASAEAVAEANGTVQITRNPPTAIAKGEAGASAVVKIEGEVRFEAGPFAAVVSGYASAGAEARASGIIGYEDGKLKLGGSLGAALGVGLGGSATVEVDVRMIGEMAKNVADVNKDGKVDFWDATAAVGKTAKWVSGWLHPKTDKPRTFIRTTPVLFTPPMVMLWSPWSIPNVFKQANVH
ncbi:MAG: hypothetical protein Q8N26_34450 [Myxococcales bacterium]|nr:hypothetical protein [Myxococcales bacterium]